MLVKINKTLRGKSNRMANSEKLIPQFANIVNMFLIIIDIVNECYTPPKKNNPNNNSKMITFYMCTQY